MRLPCRKAKTVHNIGEVDHRAQALTYDATYIDARTGNKAKGKELFNGRINRNHKKDAENLHKYRSKKVSKGRRSIRR